MILTNKQILEFLDDNYGKEQQFVQLVSFKKNKNLRKEEFQSIQTSFEKKSSSIFDNEKISKNINSKEIFDLYESQSIKKTMKSKSKNSKKSKLTNDLNLQTNVILFV